MTEKYIFETPDEGETVTRRKMGTFDKEVEIEGCWMSVSGLQKLALKVKQEEKIRKNNKAAQDAWEHYQLMLKLAGSNE